MTTAEASTRARGTYPLPAPTDDPRFSFGLLLEVAAALTAAGYPELTATDLVELQQALLRFLYANPPGLCDREG